MYVSWNCFVKRRMATPSKTRPVRPERCFADACEHQAVTRHDMCRRLS